MINASISIPMLWKCLNITISIIQKNPILIFTAFLYQKKSFLQLSHQQLEEKKTHNFFSGHTSFFLRSSLRIVIWMVMIGYRAE